MIQDLVLSLEDLTGKPYMEALCRASAYLGLGSYEELLKTGQEKIHFFPDSFRKKQEKLFPETGKVVTEGLSFSSQGAATGAFAKAFDKNNAPLSGLGCCRLGEDGKIHLAAKSEHYQASCGHNFPGYKLLENALKLGITNITHNNTRGHITRLLEEELICAANGVDPEDTALLKKVKESRDPHVLNRVINLETGSLVCEAALKMMLCRFYKLHGNNPDSPYKGKTPVFLVMGSLNGTCEANYHGTTIITQMFRGMWPELYEGMEKAGLLKVVPVMINDKKDFEAKVREYDTGSFKAAGFFHELILMNYGVIRLEKEYVQFCHKLCHEHDIPVMVDEIQSGMWSEKIMLFREYECTPDFVSVGKGFPGGMYPTSKILTTSELDALDQFGALVTNGQEELASLANLVTMRFARHNSVHIREMGLLWEKTLQSLAQQYPEFITTAEGKGLLGTLFFRDAEKAVAFGHSMVEEYCIDVSAQAYKANCPPAALTKLPLVVTEEMIVFIRNAMETVLEKMGKEESAHE